MQGQSTKEGFDTIRACLTKPASPRHSQLLQLFPPYANEPEDAMALVTFVLELRPTRPWDERLILINIDGLDNQRFRANWPS